MGTERCVSGSRVPHLAPFDVAEMRVARNVLVVRSNGPSGGLYRRDNRLICSRFPDSVVVSPAGADERICRRGDRSVLRAR